jgi:hypothetical protein
LKGVLERSEDKIPVLRVPAFVNLVNLSLQSNTKFTLPYIESIYQMAEMTSSCNGIITIRYLGMSKKQNDNFSKCEYNEQKQNDSFKPYLFLQTNDGEKHKVYIPIDTIKASEGVYIAEEYKQISQNEYSLLKNGNLLQNSFVTKFLQQYKESRCKFISIALSLKSTGCGHSNMLLIYKGKTSTYLMLYEPHGAQGLQSSKPHIVKQYNDMTRSFITFLAGVINVEEGREGRKRRKARSVEIVNPTTISERIGIQQYIKDRNGYCNMISSFWLYIILNLVKENIYFDKQVEKLFLNLNYVERCLYSIVDSEIEKDKKLNPKGSLHNYHPSQVLYSILVHFSFDFLTKYYMNYLKPPSELYELFVRELISHYKNEMKDLSKFNELILYEYTDDKGTNPPEEYLKQIQLNAEEETVGVIEDGNSCENHNQCKSTYCKDGICTSIDYSKPQIDSQEASDHSQSSVSSASESGHSDTDPTQTDDHYKCDATQEDLESYSQHNPEQPTVNKRRIAEQTVILDGPLLEGPLLEGPLLEGHEIQEKQEKHPKRLRSKQEI